MSLLIVEFLSYLDIYKFYFMISTAHFTKHKDLQSSNFCVDYVIN